MNLENPGYINYSTPTAQIALNFTRIYTKVFFHATCNVLALIIDTLNIGDKDVSVSR